MVRETLLDPERLYASIDFLKQKTRANQVKIERELQEIGDATREIATRKKRIVDLYGMGELDREEYTRKIQEYDKEVESLEAKHKELLKFVPLFEKKELVKASVAAHCRTMKKRFTACVDFATKRQFLLDFVTKVVYRKTWRTSATVKLCGMVPIKTDAAPEPIMVSFTANYTIGQREMIGRYSKGIPADDAYYGAKVARAETYQFATL